MDPFLDRDSDYMDPKLLLTTLTTVGFEAEGTYQLDEYALNSIKVLSKYLRCDDSKCSSRQQIGQSNIWAKDLIPILKAHPDDDELFLAVIKLMLSLSLPPRDVFKNFYGAEDFPKDAEFQYNFKAVQETLYQYKESFIDETLWISLKTKIHGILSTDWETRSLDDSLTIERILWLIKNILHIPSNHQDQNRAPGEDTVHDKVSKVLIDSEFSSILILIASNDDCIQYRDYVMEIIAYLLREQDPKSLAQSDTNIERLAGLKELRKDAEKEKLSQRLAQKHQSSRHSRFGGTFAVINQAGQNIVTNKLYKNVQDVSRDRVKAKVKSTTRKCKGEELHKHRTSSKVVRASLQKFCDQFLDYGYNSCMASARHHILRNEDTLEDNHEVFYFHNMTVFMNYATSRPTWALADKVGYISETLSIPTLSFIERSMHKYNENITCDKQRQNKWTTKLNYAIRAFQQVMKTILTMHKSKDENMKQSANQIKEQILYTPEYREIVPELIKRFKPAFQTKNYLRDLIMAQHWLLKLLDGSSEIVIRSRAKPGKSRNKKPEKEKSANPKPISDNAQRDGTWNDVVEDINTARMADIDTDEVMGYGLLEPSGNSMKALGAIQLALHGRQRVRNVSSAELSVRLLRAARHLWPENTEFGDIENEVETLEILCKEKLPSDAFPEDAPVSSDNDMGEEAGYEYEEITEAIIDVKDIIDGYSHPDVLHKAGMLLQDFKFNSGDTNHAICKLIHRIVFQLEQPSMCFQATLFRTFQKINNEKIELRTNPIYKEIWTLGRFVLKKFFEVLEKNEKLPIELLLWTARNDWEPIMTADFADNFVKRSGIWSEELDEELRRLAEENRLVNDAAPEMKEDLMNFIEQQFSDSSKSSAQLRRRCLKLGLLQKSATYKSNSVIWTEQMTDKLTILFREYSSSGNPISKIQDHGIEISRAAIVDKLLDLGLILDKSEVQKKRKAKEPDAEGIEDQGILRAAEYENIPHEDVEEILRRCRWNDKLEGALKWVKAEVDDEINDRQESSHDDWVDRSLVPQDIGIAEYLERSHMKSVLKSGHFLWPNHEHTYWRIGVGTSLNELEFYASSLGEFEPAESMYGPDIDSEPEILTQRVSSSEDEIALFRKVVKQNTPSPKERKKFTKKRRANIPKPVGSSTSSDEEHNEIAPSPGKLKHLNLNESDDENPNRPVAASVVAEMVAKSSDEETSTKPMTLDSDSDEEIKPKRRRAILDSDSD